MRCFLICVLVAVLASLGFVGNRAYGAATGLDQNEVVALMKKMGDWQLANMPDKSLVVGKMRPIVSNGWIRAAFYTGVMALYDTTGDQKYLDAAMSWAEANNWKLGKRPRHADDHCAGQTYAELYLIKHDPKMIEAMRNTFDPIVADPKRGPVVGWDKNTNWSWCDSLYMAPPAMARLSAATGDPKYLDCMNTLWWDVVNHLYDKDEHLFFRDARYMQQPDGTWPRLSPNGKKVFWSRGNGWVMGGTVRVLQYMPQNYPDRPKYVELLKQMADKIASIQGDDGLWRASLLDPVAYPAPETSGSGFFCYAITWGINQGILDRDKYLPVVEKAWRGLASAVNDEGRLGWVQQVGADPQSVSKSDSMEYGTGAMLLAGSELVKLGLPVVKLSNPLDISRSHETVSMPLDELGIPQYWFNRVSLRNEQTGRTIISQIIDMDSDGKPDQLVFQVHTKANGQKTLAVQVGPRPFAKEPSKVHAMFVPTRYDDFAWENDRIAYRMYGPGLQHTDNEKERLTSSGVDVWAKKVSYPVIEKWYQGGNYHTDSGEGLDFYKVGPSRGCGGTAVWANDKMYVSENFTDWKIIADGPIRTVFELTYAPWDVNGKKISEIKRVTLDAGSNLNRFDSFYKTDGKKQFLTYAIGLHIVDVSGRKVIADKNTGQLIVWEPAGKNGNLGLAVIVRPSNIDKIIEAEGHNLVIADTEANGHATFYAGAGWDKSSDFASEKDWVNYVNEFAKRVAAPLDIIVEKR